ncbi:MAG: MG2 domain-containing protein, partial [Flavobacteriaceae bacterium]
MKQIVPLIMIILFSQMGISQQNDDSYEVLWSQVRQLESEALTKSALDLVKSISEKAKKEKNSAQMVKALLYASKYALTLEEDAQLKIVTDFRSEIEKADFPTKNILESYLAHMYWQYFQTNRYQFYDRTKTEVKVDAVDFRTWDLNTLFEEINHHFEASLANREQLQTILVSQFDELLYKQPNSENYRPTLFDLLAHTALEFYGTDENSITRPADKFVIDDPEILCEADTFIALKIDTTDATSLQSKALEIYQQLLRQHRNTSLPYLLAEVDIQRLHFIYRNATFENKEERFLEVLQNSAHTTAGSSASTLYTYEIAALLSQQGDGYRPKVSELQRWKKKKALELCESVIASAPNSRGADKCLALKSALLATSLQLTTEQFLPNDKTSRLLVDYKNVSQLQFSARKVTDKQLLQLNELYPEEKIRAFIEKLPVVKEWNVELKNENDHQNHRTEVTMPPLGNNQYIIFTFPKNTEDKSFAYSAVQVTDMALTETRSPTEHTFQVIDRLNGKPIAGADVKLTYLKNYNRPYVSKSFETDKMGMVAISLKNEYWSDVSVRVTKSGETAHFGQFQINERYNNSANQSSGSCFLFTDRSIYRPGQPLYFKGIAVKTANGISSILENTQITVDLLDVNYQVVGSQQLVTNGYGSFSGEFIVPNSGLTGNFTLRANSTQAGLNGSTSFSVEEYKRPKFETFFDPIKESYKVNDSITVQGRAIAYAGSTISDAKVSYRVSRVVYFPRWYYWYHPYLNHTPQEIAHGETLSDASGSFEIDFKALPDTSASKEGMPTFQYLVTADVTDINGETHSTSTTVTVGYHTMRANMYLADPLDKDKKDNKLTISTTNLNGMAVGAKGSVKMYKLEAPEQVLRPRPWASPDYEGFTKSEFKKLFPHDAFGNEHDPKNWEKGELVWQANFDTAKATEIAFGQMKKWLSGIYILELETEDKFGMPVKDVTQISLFSTSDTTLADNQLFEIKTDKASYAIGDKAKITLLSAATDLHVTVHVEKGGKVVDRRLIRLDNGAASFTLPINEDDLGGFGIGYSFSAYNAFQSGNLTIAVPYPVTDLQIETVTFRDKLAPGTDETWSFKIKGAKGDKVSAELLASMYDSSLDAFRGHYWSFYPKPLTYYYSQRYTNAYQSYGTRAFNTYLDHDGYYAKEPYFDSFDWFGLYFGYVGSSYGYSGRMKKSGGAPEVSPSMMMDDMELEGSAAEMLEGKAAGLSTASNAPKEKDAGNTVSDSLQVGGDRNENGGSGEGEVQIRKNLQETAFFFPQLQTDAEGNVSFSFTTPEALTRWRLQLLAHTKSLESTVLNLEAVTQKELMVLPNAPRFLREGDEIEIRTKIANLTAKPLSGEAKLTLVDAVTGENISKLLLAASGPADGKVLAGQKRFAVDSMGNGQVSWRLKIPEGLQAVQYTVSAKAGDFSDGEQNLLPVLTNRMLVTETLPMWVRSDQTK